MIVIDSKIDGKRTCSITPIRVRHNGFDLASKRDVKDLTFRGYFKRKVVEDRRKPKRSEDRRVTALIDDKNRPQKMKIEVHRRR